MDIDLDILTAIVFLAFASGLFVLGRLFVAGGRNDQRKRPLTFGIFTHVLAFLFPLITDNKNIQQDLRRAGYYHRYALREFLAIRNVLILGWLLFAAAVYWLVAIPNPSWKLPVFVVGVTIFAMLFSVPRLILQVQASDRLRRIQRTLPDAVDMITMVMTGGVSLEKALDHVSRELVSTHPDLSCELAIITKQTQASSLDYALNQFANRIDTPDVQSLAALVSQSEQLGSNVTTAFQGYSDAVRRSMRQRAAERGNKASVKMLLPIIFCLAPPVYILLLAPALLEMRSFVIEQNEPGGALAQDIEIEAPSVRRAGAGSTES